MDNDVESDSKGTKLDVSGVKDKPTTNEVLIGKLCNSPGEVVSNIFAESVSEADRIADDYWNKFMKRGFVPQGATLEEVRKILDQAPLDGTPGVPDIRDLTHIGGEILRDEVTEGLFVETPSGGVSISPRHIDNLMRSNNPSIKALATLLNEIKGFRGDALLLGLHAAYCNSAIARQDDASLRRIAEVPYLHKNGTKTILRLDTGIGNFLTQLAEDALIKATGKL